MSPGPLPPDRWLRLDPAAPDPEVLRRAGRSLAQGALVVFPTETVYGIGANALDGAAVGRIYAAKGRPPDNPLIVHVATREALPSVAADLPRAAERLIERFWPGPLTLVLPRAPGVPGETTAGLSTVGVRMPDHPVALGLIAAAGVPVAAPSANRSGRPSPTLAEHAAEDLGDTVDLLLDAGPTGIGVESTVLDVTVDPPELLRPGGLPLEALEAVVGAVRVPAHLSEGLAVDGPVRSPGMKYRHYAPRTPVFLYTGEPGAVRRALAQALREERRAGGRVALLGSEETVEQLGALADATASLGSRPEEAAARLFVSLRALDAREVRVILAEGLPERGLGFAVMNRLKRAAARHVIASAEQEGGPARQP